MKAALLVVFTTLSLPCMSQQPQVVSPKTAGELKQMCKSYDLVVLEIEFKKPVAWRKIDTSDR